MKYLSGAPFSVGGSVSQEYRDNWEATFKRKTCRSAYWPDHVHARPCGQVPGHEDMCACGCDAYGEICTAPVSWACQVCGGSQRLGDAPCFACDPGRKTCTHAVDDTCPGCCPSKQTPDGVTRQARSAGTSGNRYRVTVEQIGEAEPFAVYYGTGSVEVSRPPLDAVTDPTGHRLREPGDTVTVVLRGVGG